MLECWGGVNEDEDVVRERVDRRLKQCERLTLPTLLVRGRMSDVVSQANVDEFLAHVPHAEFINLEGAAHMVAGDRNDAFTSSVAEFILEHFPPVGETSDDQ